LRHIKVSITDTFMYHYIVPQRPRKLPVSRARLATVLRAGKEVISIELASKALHTDRPRASQTLSRWQRQGWLRRVGPGLYAPVPLDLADSEQVVADPWVLVPALFGESYLGGWTAAHHWELTEQLFKDTLVFTRRRIVKTRVTAQGVTFVLKHAPAKHLLFGLKTVWRGTTKVAISDPARTVIDILAAPELGGGIDHVAECLTAYLKSKDANRELLIRYGERLANGAVFKRLGFLAETLLRDQPLIDACRTRLTQGYARLDSSLPSARLVTRWKLWVPIHWKGTVR